MKIPRYRLSAMFAFNPEIFREYDIRGIVERDLTPSVVEALGRAFATYLRRKGIDTVAVGYDARVSSPRFCDDIVRGLASGGVSVTVLGLCPTPALYFSLHYLNPGAGIMITGSHNPAEFNGFKLCVGKDTIHGVEIQKIRQLMTGTRGTSTHRGTVEQRAILPDYINQLKNLFPTPSGPALTVVLDSGNGTAGLVAPEIIRGMGCEVIELYSEPDGRFPHHHPDPTIPKNLAALIDMVRSRNADVGIAFDGDADRIGLVDEQGNIIWGDQLMIMFARDILSERPGATFVSEVKCSQNLFDDIRKRGGNAVMWKAGHSLIKAKMKELDAVMGGEMSGHLFFADRYFGYDDAIYAACRVVELLKKRMREGGRAVRISEILADLPKTYTTPEIRIDCPDAVKFQVVEKLKELLISGELLLRPRELITIDGVRALFDRGWGLVRASNTQPVLVMRFEAVDPDSLAKIGHFMEGTVNGIVATISPEGPVR